MGQKLKTGILLFEIDWSLDTSLLDNERIFDLKVQCLRSFSASKHLVKTGTILESRCRGCFDAIDPNIFPARIWSTVWPLTLDVLTLRAVHGEYGVFIINAILIITALSKFMACCCCCHIYLLSSPGPSPSPRLCPNRPPSWIKVPQKRKKEKFWLRADSKITWAIHT